MIDIVHAGYAGDFVISLRFSDDTAGDYDMKPTLEGSGSLLGPLRDEGYFNGFFLDYGALCWKNGLELAPAMIHQRLEEAGGLYRAEKAASA